MKSWFLYIAQSRSKNYYVGITTDVKRRITEHNTGKGSRMAHNQGPFILVFQSKPIPTKSEARKLEIRVKDWSRAKKQKLISGQWQYF